MKRSGHEGYLTGGFFTEVCPSLGEDTVMVIAHEGENPVAAALYFVDNNTLYGRYWGCLKEFDFLHFEACYYRGIEYCIEKDCRVSILALKASIRFSGALNQR